MEADDVIIMAEVTEGGTIGCGSGAMFCQKEVWRPGRGVVVSSRLEAHVASMLEKNKMTPAVNAKMAAAGKLKGAMMGALAGRHRYR
ncbi:hypothetical protein ACOMHN_022840 [Nucella lapillus]